MSRSIPESHWEWCGYAGHFIAADGCRFRLHTRIGNYRISTVGDWRPSRSRERAEEIGVGRLYETFVFRVHDGEFACGEIDEGIEIEADSYNDGELANRGHIAICNKYARIAGEEAPR